MGAVNGSLTVTNSEFSYNTCDEGTSDDGCGLYLYFDTTVATGNALVRNNYIHHDTLNHNPHPVGNCDGAGLMIYHLGTDGTAPTVTVADNRINDNLTYEGAAGLSFHVLHQHATVTMTSNVFARNVAGPLPGGTGIQIQGGGVDLYVDGGTMTVNNNMFMDNEITDPFGNGAGFCLSSLPSGTLEMRGNIFVGNRNTGPGGGALIYLAPDVTSAVIAQNLFVDNRAGIGDSEGSAGGLSLASDVPVQLVNNTFYNNSADEAGAMSFYSESQADADLSNEVYWGNTPNAVSVYRGSVMATYSNIQGGTGEPYFGTGCLDTDPLFFNASLPAGADGVYATADDGLHLTAASPSMNAGTNATVPGGLSTDLAGQARIQNTTVDMGGMKGKRSPRPDTPSPAPSPATCSPMTISTTTVCAISSRLSAAPTPPDTSCT